MVLVLKKDLSTNQTALLSRQGISFELEILFLHLPFFSTPCIVSLLGVLAPGVWAWPLRVHLRQRCHVKITKMAAAVWSTSPSSQENMTSTLHLEDCLSQVSELKQIVNPLYCNTIQYNNNNVPLLSCRKSLSSPRERAGGSK